MSFAHLIDRVRSGEDLTPDESREAVCSMVERAWTEAESEEFLVSLRQKGESPREVVGFATAMRELAVEVHCHGKETMDTCGTGGDRKCGFNISTLVAFVLAGCGIPVVKHGNRAASSSCGSADLLEALGIRCRLHAGEAVESLEETGFAFLFAPDYHPAARSVASIRRRIGGPTIFNLLGPLTNPARPAAQLIGVYDRGALPVMAEAIRILDPEKRAALLHSSMGWDEATPSGSFYVQSNDGRVAELEAEELGIARCTDEELLGGSPSRNAHIAAEILQGKPGARRDTVLLNAMLAYGVFYPGCSRSQALADVTASLDTGAAGAVVEGLRTRYPL